MQANCSENEELFEKSQDQSSDGETLPNFAFPNLKDDPDLQYEFNTDDANQISVKKYLDEAITSNLSTLEFKWRSECLICAERFEEFQDLFQHCKEFHKNEFDEYTCTLQDCDVVIPTEDLLARHFVLQHSDLESVKIYGSCPYCDLRFSNFNQLNKHSCYNKLTRKACEQSYCQYCKEEFVSHKRFIFHLQFHMAERRPKVCLICNNDFEDVDEFFVHVNYGHEPPDLMACTVCDRKFIKKTAFMNHQKLHKLKHKYKCDECSKSYHIKRLLVNHKQNCHTDIEYKCDLCPKVFPSFSILQNHIKWHNTDAEVHVCICTNCGLVECDSESLEKKHAADSSSECFEFQIEEEILIATYRCNFCAKDYKDMLSLKKHRATGVHDNGKFLCPICNEELEDPKAKRIHMMSAHKNYKHLLDNLPLKRLWMCDVGDCEECYSEWPALQRHKSRLHKPNTCQKCKIKIANADELKNHITQCLATAFTCQFCEKICPTRMSLAVHVARSHNKKQFYCPHCSAAYKDEQALKQHIDYRHVPVPCTHCEKVINCRQYLELHMRAVHESETRYFCAYCNKGYYHRSQKELHEENVHPDSVYKCGECNFTTRYAKSLEIHVAKHLEKSKFKCPHCPRKFGRKHTLKLHIKRHKDDKPFRCSDTIVDGCDAAYIARHLLNRHIQTKHSTQPPKSKVKKRKTRNAASQRKSTRISSTRTQAGQLAYPAAAINCENANATPNIVNSDVDMNGVGLESKEAIFTTVETADEITFMDVESLQNGNDENYTLLIVDDDALEMVNNRDVASSQKSRFNNRFLSI